MAGGVIDIRNPQGKFGGSGQAAAQLIQAIGEGERKRRDRQILNRFVTERAANPDKPVTEIIEELQQSVQFDEGIAGGFQKLAGRFGGQSSVLPQLQGMVAEEAITPQRQAAAPKTTPPFQKTAEVSARDRDTKFLQAQMEEDINDRDPVLIQEAHERLIANPALREIVVGTRDAEFEKLVADMTPELVRDKNVFMRLDDRVFGVDSFKKVLSAATTEGLQDGFTETSIEIALREWWNRQAAKDQGKRFRKFQPIPEFPPEGASSPLDRRDLAAIGPQQQRIPGESIDDFEKRTGG